MEKTQALMSGSEIFKQFVPLTFLHGIFHVSFHSHGFFLLAILSPNLEIEKKYCRSCLGQPKITSTHAVTQ